MSILEKARHIKLLILDVDGVLTDGRIIYSDGGDELKFFNAQDGHGIKLLMRAGLDVAIVTGRSSKAVLLRADNLGISMVYQKALNKIEAYEDILKRKSLTDQNLCVVGDDLPDLPLLRRCGFSCAVPNSVAEVLSSVDYVTRNAGGRGAVREVCELVLKAQGLWEQATARYY